MKKTWIISEMLFNIYLFIYFLKLKISSAVIKDVIRNQLKTRTLKLLNNKNLRHLTQFLIISYKKIIPFTKL
jgi:hypothetical protein